MNVHDTRRQCANVVDMWASGWPVDQTSWPVWPAGPTLQPRVGRLHGDTLQEAVKGNLKPKVY
jgi:hypothetical protein